jgi:Fusaric acid resistance protein-like
MRHLSEVLRWSTAARVGWVAIVASALGMAVPVLVGAAMGNLRAGLAASVGGLLVGGATASRDLRAHIEQLVTALGPAVAAVTVAAFAAGHGWLTDAVVALLGGVAAAIAGLGRPLAVMAMRFVLFLIIAITVAETASNEPVFAVLILAGALWASAVGLALGAQARAMPGHRGLPAAPDPPNRTAKPSVARLRRLLAHPSGWQYALRLMSCLAVAGGLRWWWPEHHLHWIALTVALMMEWRIETVPVRTTQRALGVALGVLATGVLLVYTPTAWALVLGIAVLAGLRPMLHARNYLAYSTAMTPLIIMLLDAGQPLGIGILLDRLIATAIGAGLVIGANWIAGKAIARPA